MGSGAAPWPRIQVARSPASQNSRTRKRRAGDWGGRGGPCQKVPVTRTTALLRCWRLSPRPAPSREPHLERVQKPHDVRVHSLAQTAHFAFQAFPQLRAQLAGVDFLHRRHATVRDVRCTVHGGEAAGANQLRDAPLAHDTRLGGHWATQTTKSARVSRQTAKECAGAPRGEASRVEPQFLSYF